MQSYEKVLIFANISATKLSKSKVIIVFSPKCPKMFKNFFLSQLLKTIKNYYNG